MASTGQATSPVTPEDATSAFTCGEAATDSFFARHAVENHEKGIGTTFVLRGADEGDPPVLAFYTLSMSAVPAKALRKAAGSQPVPLPDASCAPGPPGRPRNGPGSRSRSAPSRRRPAPGPLGWRDRRLRGGHRGRQERGRRRLLPPLRVRHHRLQLVATPALPTDIHAGTTRQGNTPKNSVSLDGASAGKPRHWACNATSPMPPHVAPGLHLQNGVLGPGCPR